MTQAPPAATAADKKRVKALIRAAAKTGRHGAPSIGPDGEAWIEDKPQSLWPILDEVVALLSAEKRDEALAGAGLWLLANQLELIRYRLDRGYDWAAAMLETYQHRLIELARDRVLEGPDWLSLVNLLRDAKVPVRPDMAEAMAMALAEEDIDDARAAAEGPAPVRSLVDELGRLSDNPFTVVEALNETGSLLPVEIRSFMTHELGLSRHAVLRETLPLLLLDAEPETRRAASAILEQIAVPETFSPVMMRRCLLVRNGVPEAERAPIDRVVRKARLKGVACAQWAPAPDLAIQVSMMDGSGAQGAIFNTPKGRKGLLAGLLLKQHLGVTDTWCHRDVPRKDIARMVEATRQDAAWLPMGRDFLDMAVQHHLHKGAALGLPPGPTLIEIAEEIGAADWKDRALDVQAEIARLYREIGPTPEAPGQDVWMIDSPIVQSWFEDDPTVRAMAVGKPKPKQAAIAARVLKDVLPDRRGVWAERMLLLALWLRAGRGNFMPIGSEWRGCAWLAHDLLAGRDLAELPPMVAIAERTAFAARAGRR